MGCAQSRSNVVEGDDVVGEEVISVSVTQEDCNTVKVVEEAEPKLLKEVFEDEVILEESKEPPAANLPFLSSASHPLGIATPDVSTEKIVRQSDHALAESSVGRVISARDTAVLDQLLPLRHNVELDVDPDKNITYVGKIADSRFGSVQKARWTDMDGNVHDVAARVVEARTCHEAGFGVSPDCFDEAVYRGLQAELDMMCRGGCPSILRCFGGCIRGGTAVFVMEPATGRSLGHLMKEKQENGGRMSTDEVIWALSRVACSLTFLHPLVIHGSIGPMAMIKLDPEDDSSFRLSKFYKSSLAIGPVGEPLSAEDVEGLAYLAPEVQLPEVYGRMSCKTDVFCLGMMVWQLMAGKAPWEDLNLTREELARKIAHENARPRVPQNWPPLIRTMILACWAQDPGTRPPAQELVRTAETMRNTLLGQVGSAQDNDNGPDVELLKFLADVTAQPARNLPVRLGQGGLPEEDSSSSESHSLPLSAVLRDYPCFQDEPCSGTGGSTTDDEGSARGKERASKEGSSGSGLSGRSSGMKMAEKLKKDEQRLQALTRLLPLKADVDLEVDPFNDIQYMAKLGRGGYGSVYSGWWRSRDGSKKQVAVKVVDVEALSATRDKESVDSLLRAVRNEMSIMSRLDHPCIVRCYGGCVRSDRACLLLEFMEGGDLSGYLHQQRGSTGLALDEILHVGYELVEALHYLHPYIVHADLKPSNVVLDASGSCKLTDFGMSRIKMETLMTTQLGGTPAYVAPEIFNHQEVSEKCDIYSLGMVLWECLTGQLPWGDATYPLEIALEVLMRGMRPPMPADTPPEVADLIQDCWNPLPSLRPHAHELLGRLQTIWKQLQQKRSSLDSEPSTRVNDSAHNSSSADAAVDAVVDPKSRAAAEALGPPTAAAGVAAGGHAAG